MSDLLHFCLPPGKRSKIVDHVPSVGGREPRSIIWHRFFADGDFPKELAVCLFPNPWIGEFGWMNAQINRVRSIAVSRLSVTCHATFQIDFLSRREGRFIDSFGISLSCLGGRSGQLLFRARLFLAHGGEGWAEEGRENSQQLQARG